MRPTGGRGTRQEGCFFPATQIAEVAKRALATLKQRGLKTALVGVDSWAGRTRQQLRFMTPELVRNHSSFQVHGYVDPGQFRAKPPGMPGSSATVKSAERNSTVLLWAVPRKPPGMPGNSAVVVSTVFGSTAPSSQVHQKAVRCSGQYCLGEYCTKPPGMPGNSTTLSASSAAVNSPVRGSPRTPVSTESALGALPFLFPFPSSGAQVESSYQNARNLSLTVGQGSVGLQWGPLYVSGSDLGVSLFMARQIIESVNYMGATAWCYWQPIDAYFLWSLINVTKWDNNGPGEIVFSKKYFVLQHFTWNVSPGSRAIAISSTVDCRHGAAAFYDPSTRSISIFAVNQEGSGAFALLRPCFVQKGQHKGACGGHTVPDVPP